MTQAILSAAKWREIAHVWRRLGEVSSISFEESLRCAASGLKSLLEGSHVMLVIQRRAGPPSAPLGGFQPLFSRDFGPDVEMRLKLTRQWAAHEPRLADDPVLRQVVAEPGTLRVVRHRADTDPEQWQSAPVRRLLEQLKLEDRVNGIVPVGPDVDVSFCIDRPLGEPIFDDRDRRVLLEALEGLRQLAAQFVRCHGFRPGQHPLDDYEQDVVHLLLSPATEADIAESLDTAPAQLDEAAEQIYEKLNVGSRLELIQLCNYGGAQPAELSPPDSEPPSHLEADPPLESGPVVPRVREEIGRALDGGESDIEAVANELGMSVRALQRELRKTETSFRALATDGRRHRAELLLSRPWLDFTEIAFRLGYSQVTSFNRAVKRWTGKTPSQMRRELLEDA